MATLHEKMEDLKIEKNPSELPENVEKVEENPSNLLPEKIKKEKNKKSGVSDKKAGNTLEMDPPPSFIADRIKMFDKLKLEYDEEIKAKEKLPIKVVLLDGKEVDALSWQSTPYHIAQGISQGLADNSVIAKGNSRATRLIPGYLKISHEERLKILILTKRREVNGELWDLDRVLEGDCKMEFLKFEQIEGQQVFWHSSAHILGEAMERHYGGCLCYGPPIEEGFYYDMWTDRQVSTHDFGNLETLTKNIIKEKQQFVRLEMKREDLLKMFEYNEFKLRIINEKITTPTTTVYRCGPLIDLCRGPHVRHTGKVKALAVTKNSATYWEGNKDAESLQRLYGISFPNDKMLKEWKHFQEEAAKRDHRKIGKEQELFFFHDLSPGSAFFLPKGACIYNTLVDFIRSEYVTRGFQEVITPNMFSTKLWEQSGHWQHYANNMFSFEIEKERFALKPMNCPGHCVMFNNRPRSWRELPLRFADFGVLHRNELSGALTGLTRVRRFQQDDAHIFCTLDQVESEIKSCLQFLRHVYSIFGFTFKLFLSTRPDKYLGDIKLWDHAEKQLESSLNDFGDAWELNPGDGAFYGPKIDIQIRDALRRYHQCATIQLDFQLPERFNLTYVSGDGDDQKRPVIIHRAILGSVERMIAILTENYGGKWPFWLSPIQAVVIPVSNKFDDYAVKVHKFLQAGDFKIDINLDAGETLNKKIRNAQLMHYNFILVVGDKEMSSNTVNVRTRDNKVHGEKSLEVVLARFNELRISKKDDSENEF